MLTASGVGYEADTGYVDYVHFRTYHSSDTETPTAVVSQFLADGLDGELRLTVTDQLGDSTRHLTVFRRGSLGSATFWHGFGAHRDCARPGRAIDGVGAVSSSERDETGTGGFRGDQNGTASSSAIMGRFSGRQMAALRGLKGRSD